MSADDQLSLAEHLSRLRDRAGMTLDQVAEAAGYKGRSSVQRYFEDQTIETVKPAIAAKIAKAFYLKGDPKIRISDLKRLVVKPGRQNGISDAGAAMMLDVSLTDEDGPQAIEYRLSDRIPVVGFAYASNWMEATPSLDVPIDWLAIPFNVPENEDLYALQVRGNSLNKIAPEGHYAICNPYKGRASAFPTGCYVHVERERDGLLEWSIKKAVWSSIGMELHPHSTDPAHQEPLFLGDRGYTVTVRGLVIGWFLPA